VFVARRQPDGTIKAAGAIELGLRREILDELEDRLADLPARRRGAIAWYPAEVSVIASVHGLADGLVRDAVLQRVDDDHASARLSASGNKLATGRRVTPVLESSTG
jgi:hypothetical protein